MKPSLVYVLYGSDRFTRDEQVRGLKRRMLAEPAGEFNLTELSGKDFGLNDIRAATDALPFMADRRMVVVEGLLGRLAGASKPSSWRGKSASAKVKRAPSPDEGALEAFLAYLGQVPDTTALVVVEDSLDPALLAGRVPPERAHVRAYERPRPGEVARWIDRRVKHHHGKMEAAAARQLAQLQPDDLGLLDNEILKLVTYAGDRTVTTEDVELLSSTPDVTIFGLIDALADGGGDPRSRGQALSHLRSLFLRGERTEAIVPQIAGALRRLIQARELLDRGQRGPELQRQLGVHPFVAEKTERQARTFSMEQLEASLRRLLETDRKVKTGEAEPELALELFIVDLPRP